MDKSKVARFSWPTMYILAFWPLHQLRLLRTFLCSLRTLRAMRWIELN